MSKKVLGELIVPLLGLALAVFLMHEQLTGRFSRQTIRYTMALGVPTIILIALVTLQAVRSDLLANRRAKQVPGEPFLKWQNIQVALFLLMTCVMLLTLEWIGYVLAFSSYVLLTAILLGIRSRFTLVTVTVGAMAFIYFVFVVWLGLRLPPGLLRGWF